jgi:FAD:protein FMN transferase
MSATVLQRRRLGTAGLLGLVLLLASACQQPYPVRVLQGSTMGTTWTVRLAGMPPELDEATLRGGIDAVLETVNAQMSTYREDSDISRFNQLPAGASLVLPDELMLVLRAALELAEDSGGAYDPTVGPLVNLWGFGAESLHDEAPAQAWIDEALARVGWQRLDWDRHSPLLVQPGGVYLDLSSIAKGYAVDRVLEYLVEQGVQGVLVDIGGDTRMRGRKPDGSAWRIAVEQPLPGPRAAQRVIEPGDRAVATSGSYRNYFDDGDQRYSHTIDPRTGYPVQHDLLSVTVVHESCLQADALATALGVLGPEAGYAFAAQRGLAVLFLQQQDGSIVERMTPAFQDLID